MFDHEGTKKKSEARSQESAEKAAQGSQQEIICVICVHLRLKGLTTEAQRRTGRKAPLLIQEGDGAFAPGGGYRIQERPELSATGGGYGPRLKAPKR